MRRFGLAAGLAAVTLAVVPLVIRYIAPLYVWWWHLWGIV